MINGAEVGVAPAATGPAGAAVSKGARGVAIAGEGGAEGSGGVGTGRQVLAGAPPHTLGEGGGLVVWRRERSSRRMVGRLAVLKNRRKK